jgi:chorismate mutase
MVVSADVLPEVFTKVLEVKRLIARGEQKSSAAACKAVGISRSAYYKYKDSIFSYEEKLMQKIISLYAVLRDEPGVLSSVLAALHSLNANILTVNQNIPIDGVAAVTLSLRLNDVGEPYMLKSILSGIHGVVDVKIISGE